MKNLMIDFAEGLIFGLLLAILVHILGIEVTGFQLGVITAFSIIAVSVLNTAGMHFKGKGVADIGEPAAATFAINKTWTYKHEDNIIEIRNTAKLCELIVNGQVQDSIKGVVALRLKLSGKLHGGEEVKASFAQMQGKWLVLVGDEVLKEAVLA